MSALSARLSQCIASDLLVFCVWGIVVQVVVLCVRNKWLTKCQKKKGREKKENEVKGRLWGSTDLIALISFQHNNQGSSAGHCLACVLLCVVVASGYCWLHCWFHAHHTHTSPWFCQLQDAHSISKRVQVLSFTRKKLWWLLLCRVAALSGRCCCSARAAESAYVCMAHYFTIWTLLGHCLVPAPST